MPRGLQKLRSAYRSLSLRSIMLYLIAGAIVAYALYQAFWVDDRDDRPSSHDISRRPLGYCPPVRDEQRTTDSSQRDYSPVEAFWVDDRDDRPPSHDISRRPLGYNLPVRDERGTTDSSQRDYSPVEAWATLRARAKQEGDLMSQCFRQSKEAYERRDHARAKALSEQGKHHSSKMETLNANASAIIFAENNKDRDVGEVDLHNLYVKEAIAYAEKAITKARQRGDSEIRLIVGQGNHSDGGVSRLKPAIQGDMRERGLPVEVDPKNPGVLIVRLGRR